MVNQLVQVEVGNSLKRRTKAEAKRDSLVDVDTVEDVANNSNNISFRQSVIPNSSSLNLNWIQLQQFSRVVKIETGVVDSKVVMAVVVIAAVVMAVMGVECVGFARVQGTMLECAHSWRRLRSG